MQISILKKGEKLSVQSLQEAKTLDSVLENNDINDIDFHIVLTSKAQKIMS